jgi:hydroxymethylpyrimidine/phosphomethylpyrimidine kinase
MSLADRLEAGPATVVHGNPCSVATALSALPPKERTALQAMLDDRRWTQSMIYDALAAEGVQVGKQSVGRHRSAKCRCAP